MTYKVALIHTEEGYTILCPELPGCVTEGDTAEEAMENMKDAIQEYLAVVTEPCRCKHFRLAEYSGCPMMSAAFRGIVGVILRIHVARTDLSG